MEARELTDDESGLLEPWEVVVNMEVVALRDKDVETIDEPDVVVLSEEVVREDDDVMDVLLDRLLDVLNRELVELAIELIEEDAVESPVKVVDPVVELILDGATY